MSTDNIKLKQALNKIATSLSSDWPEKCQENVRIARRALADIDAHLKEPVQDERKALAETVRTALLYAGTASEAMRNDALAALDSLAALPQPAAADLSAEFERGRQAGITQVYDSMLAEKDPGVVDERAWPFREPL